MQGEGWHGPAVLELLSDIPAEKAAARTVISGAHSIWEIVLHIGAWLDAASQFYFLLHGLVQHNTYNAGQIALLKKN